MTEDKRTMTLEELKACVEKYHTPENAALVEARRLLEERKDGKSLAD